MALPRERDPQLLAVPQILYLDGTTAATPLAGWRSRSADRTPALQVVGRQPLQTAGILAALSIALDLTEGQLPGHALRTCFIASRLGDEMGLHRADRSALFFAAFLKDAGCSTNAAAVSRIFGGDDIELKREQATIGRSLVAYAAFAIRNLPASEPLPLRLRRLVRLALQGNRERKLVEQARCERGADIARKAGFGPDVATAIRDLHEQWDGRGEPRGLKGAAIDPLARVLAASAALDVFMTTKGAETALRVLASRAGGWYDPDVVHAIQRATERGLLEDLAAPGISERTLQLEPDATARSSDEDDVDRIASAFADIVDAKSPFTGSHSQRVAGIAEALAETLELPVPDRVDARRAGLLHDIGKLGVPNTILDKPAALDEAEFEQIRRHPELTRRILAPIPTFDRVAELGAAHHERLDGRGYFRGLAAPELNLGARIVAVADVFEALTADRPYRAAMSRAQAFEILAAETGDHLASEVVDALRDVV
jgi:putative nucleotidyltransferase with HDIG domain